MTSQLCSCGQLLADASDPNSPVRYDPELNEFYIEMDDASGCVLLRYCYHCGGMLAESRRGHLYLEVSPKEEEEVRCTIRGIQTIADVLAVLGPPDQLVTLPPEALRRATIVPERYFVYKTRWKTLVFAVLECKGGSIEFIWTAKPRQ